MDNSISKIFIRQQHDFFNEVWNRCKKELSAFPRAQKALKEIIWSLSSLDELLELIPRNALLANYYTVATKQTTKANMIRFIVQNARNAYMMGEIPLTVVPDIPIMEYGVGRPISAKEAIKAFVRPHVITELMPREQRAAITSEGFMDVIQMQIKPLSEFYQFRATGEIIHREVFMDLVKRHTTLWCGKESVGFRFGESNTIYGNLVTYNFDSTPGGFYPQKPGELIIHHIPNTNKIPSEDAPKVIIPSHYFRLIYYNHYSYLPDTADGRLVLNLMKDAFKKGNLYGLTETGIIRQGRIHKRTRLGAGSHGFPANGYLERVIGELSGVGSTPFIYSCAESTGLDPYPSEKKWRFRTS